MTLARPDRSAAGPGASDHPPTAAPAPRTPSGRGISSGWMLVPLRLFLGVTFAYAGLQKLADPTFFRSSSPSGIHAQLVGAHRLSPIGGLVGGLVHVAPLVGVVIALGELAIGLGTLVGLWSRAAAIAGMVLSFGLFLTVSFHSSPYFTGADIVFFFAWTPIAMAGAAGAPALDTWFAQRPWPDRAGPDAMSRRAVLSKGVATGALAGAVLVIGGATSVIGRLVGGTDDSVASTTAPAVTPTPVTPTPSTPAPGGSGSGSPDGEGTGPSTTPTSKPPGTKLVAATAVPVGGSVAFHDPSTGDPGIVIQGTAGHFVAFDAICPHQGCTVAYQSSARIIACPCHGSEFNPQTGAVKHGPATTGLTTIPIAEGDDGNLYVNG